jgi:hypothetical protein
MVNLKKLKIRVTGGIPNRFRDVVESAIYQTFVRELNKSTLRNMSVQYEYEWKVEYEHGRGFNIISNDTETVPYGSIMYWNNYGTAGSKNIKGGYITPKHCTFLKFPAYPGFIPDEAKKIPGNISFVLKIDGIDYVFTKMSRHPGIKAKWFIDTVLENKALQYEIFNIINEELDNRKIKESVQSKLLKQLDDKFRYVEGLVEH